MTLGPDIELPPDLTMAMAHLREACRHLRNHLSDVTPATMDTIRSLRHQLNVSEQYFDKLEAHALSVTYCDDPAAEGWKETLRRENLVAAIRVARQTHGLGLREAKDLVEAYRDKKYAFAK